MKKLINLNLTGVTRGIPLMKQYRNLFIILTVALFLTACGGGGGTAALSTSSGGGGGGGTTAPPVVQKDIATLVMEAETAVGEIDAVNPTQAQVDKANMAIMAANDAITAAGAGVDTSMHTTRLNELRPTVTVTAAELAVGAIHTTEPTQAQVDAANMAITAANAAISAAGAGVDTAMYTTRLAALQPTVTVAVQTVGILTAIEAVEMAVEALEPHHQATQAQIDAANEAIGKVLTLVGESMLEQDEKLRYIAVAGFLGQSVDMARVFVNADLMTATDAETDAMAIEQKVRAETGESIAAFGDENQLLIAAMGVSKGIADAATSEVAAIEDEVEKIEHERQLAIRAKANLIAEAAALRQEKTDIETQIKNILGVDTEQEYTDQQIVDFREEVTALEADAPILASEVGSIEADIMQLETDIASESNPTIVAQKQAELNDIKTGVTKYPHPLGTQDDMGAVLQLTYAQIKALAESTQMSAAEKRAGLTKIEEIEPDIQVKEFAAQAKDDEADEAQGHIDAINGILTPLKADLLRWQGVVGDDVAAAESEKAELVLAMLSGQQKAVKEDGVLGVRPKEDYDPVLSHDQVIEAAELYDSENLVFARAMPPTGTMTFEDIARLGDDDDVTDELDDWTFHRRSFSQNSNNNEVEIVAHSPVENRDATGLPRNHPAIALSGLKVADFTVHNGVALTYGTSHQTAPFAQYAFHYGELKGIVGTLYCDHQSGCSTSSSGLFGEGWYFTPVVNSGRGSSLGYNTELARYVDSDGDGTYELVSYVDYGMWLEEVDDALLLLRRVNLVGPSASPSDLDFGTDGSNTDTNATYEGEARGLSARKRGIRDDAVTASGHFIADVELNVEFGGSPELAGTIDNFRSANEEVQGSGHVNPAWSLTFGGVPDNNNEFDGRYTQGGVGDWSAIPYGASGERPDGFYGGFDATFRNSDNTDIGAAVGVYSVQ